MTTQPNNRVLSVCAAGSVTPIEHHVPYEFASTYAGQPVSYWILRGQYEGAYGLLTNAEFIWLRNWREAYAEDSSTEPFPSSWEEIEALVNERRASAG